MKKLLAVATIGVVGYLVVKKIKERKNNEEVEVNEEMENEEVVENVEEEIVIDNDEETIIIDKADVKIVDNIEEEHEGKIKAKINNLKNKVIVTTVKVGLIVFVNVKWLVNYIKEERAEYNKKKDVVNKFRRDYYDYINNK